jgi:hypothetical protein
MPDKEIENQITVKPAKSYILAFIIFIMAIFLIFCGVGAISCFFAGMYLDGIYYASLSIAMIVAIGCHRKIQSFYTIHVEPTVSRKM